MILQCVDDDKDDSQLDVLRRAEVSTYKALEEWVETSRRRVRPKGSTGRSVNAKLEHPQFLNVIH